MSKCGSATSSKRQKAVSETEQEIDSVRAMNSSLQAYLNHLIAFRKSLNAMSINCKELDKVNKQWVDTLNSVTDSPQCRACFGADETARHILLECSGLAEYRAAHLGTLLLEVIDNGKSLLGFLEELG